MSDAVAALSQEHAVAGNSAGAKGTELRTVSALEFARRLKYGIARRGARYAWFVGAGCSVSSGVPLAATVTKRWIEELKYLETGSSKEIENWARSRFVGYDPDDLGKIYGAALRALFYSEQDQAGEIERILGEAEPGFGYATLSQIMTHERWGGACNIALTTNFDDLLAEALQIYSQRRPHVLTHESLGRRTPLSQRSPTIVKIHGDAHLGAQYSVRGRTLLDRDVRERLRAQITESGLIFLGYGGRDDCVIDLLEGLPRGAPGGGVYWVGPLPEGAMLHWLQQRDSVWVKHRDFDELMFMIRLEFALGHPKIDRFERILRRYQEQYRRLAQRVRPEVIAATSRHLDQQHFEQELASVDKRTTAQKEHTTTSTQEDISEKIEDEIDKVTGLPRFEQVAGNKQEKERLKILPAKMAKKTTSSSKQSFLRKSANAKRKKDIAPTKADDAKVTVKSESGTYSAQDLLAPSAKDKADAVKQADLAGKKDIAAVRRSVQKRLHKARNKLRDAREAAKISSQIGDIGKARKLYEEAGELGRNSPAILCEAASFFLNNNVVPGVAERYLRRALEIDLRYSEALRLLSKLLLEVYGDVNGGEDALRLAVNAGNAQAALDYARLEERRGAFEHVHQLAGKIIQMRHADARTLAEAAIYLAQNNQDKKQVKLALERAESLNPEEPWLKLAYAVSAEKRGQRKRAGMFYRQAINAMPYEYRAYLAAALFILEVERDDEQAEQMLREAVALAPRSGLALAHLANFVDRIEGEAKKAEEIYDKALELEPNNAESLALVTEFLGQQEPTPERLEKLSTLRKKALSLMTPAALARLRRRSAISRQASIPAEDLPTDKATDPIGKKQVNNKLQEALAEAIQAQKMLDEAPAHSPEQKRIKQQFAENLEKTRNVVGAGGTVARQMHVEDASIGSLLRAARFLLAGGWCEEGLALLDRADTLAQAQGDHTSKAALMEIYFYRYAHDKGQGEKALKKVLRMVENGIRVDGRDLSKNVTRAIEDGHEDPELLRDLSHVVSEGGKPALLRKHVA